MHKCNNVESAKSATNIMILDTSTLISILVLAVFVIKVFNRVLKSNSAANLPVIGRSQRDVRMRENANHNHWYHMRPKSSFNSLEASASTAQKLNRAVLTYDFIFLMIGSAATLLFIVETLYRVYRIYIATNNSGRNLKAKWRRKKRGNLGANSEELLMCQIIVSACHDFLPQIKEL